jgi:competence protein ComEA
MPWRGQLNGKEKKMFNRKMMVAVLLVVFVGLISVLTVNAAEVQKININTATAEELARLKGIGPSHAAKIVAYREKSGPFKMPEDLMQVSGIGQKTFEANQEFIIVAESKKK